MLENATLLVVDDMEINRAILMQLFERECTVLEADNGRTALEMLDTHPEIDIVILDIVMPILDGFDTLEIIRGQKRFSSLPVIICTEHADIDVQVRALDLGSTDFITKPFNAQVVRHRVLNLLQLRQMEHRLAEQQRADQLRDTLDTIVSPLGLLEFTGDHLRALYLNQSFADLFAGDQAELAPFYTDMLSSLVPDDAKHLTALLRQNQEDGSPVDLTCRLMRRDGSVRTHEIHALAIRYGHFENPVYLTSFADITDQRRTEVALRDTDQRLKSLINAVPGGIITFEMKSPPIVTYFNDTACEILGLTREEFRAQAEKNVLQFVYPSDQRIVAQLIQEYIRNPRPMGATFRIMHKSRGIRWIRLSGAPIASAEGGLLANCVCTDVSVEKESELKLERAFEEMQYRSEHDPLTDLWNRETFNQKTHDLLVSRPDTPHVLLAVNIHRFKVINGLFGAQIGDRVLQSLGQGLVQLFGGIGIYGRMEADNFMACFPSTELNMDMILEVLDSNLKAQYEDYHIELFFGIYEVQNIHMAVDQMCDCAVMALKTVKGSAVKHYAFYDESMREGLLEEQAIAEEMNDALAGGQFVPYLQPIFSLTTRRPVSAEVLVRWQHPQKGMIPPIKFIPLFERNGFVTKLDFYIWEEACKILHRWKKQGMPVVPLSINISRIDLYHPHLCEELLSLLEAYQLDPSLLKLEITESAYIDDPQVLATVLNRLRGAGFRILMDDFGSGYSSLNTLKDMPVNIIKIDMGFLEELERSPRASSILTSVVRMAKWLDMPVIAEGVETKAQLDFLYSIGCDEGQGYFFSRPIPVSEFEALLAQSGTMEMELAPDTAGTPELDFLWNSGADATRLFSRVLGGVAIFALSDGRLETRRVSDAFYQATGCTPQELFEDSHDALELFHPEDQEALLSACENAVASRQVEHVLVRQSASDRQPGWLDLRIYHLATDKQKPLLFVAARQADLPGLPKTEEQPHQEHLRQMLDELPLGVGIYKLGKHPHLSYVNRPLARMFGYSTDELEKATPKKLAQLMPFLDAERLETTAVEPDSVLPGRRKDGTSLWFRFSRKVSLSSEGIPTCFAAVSEVTSFVESNRELIWQQERYRLLAEHTDTVTFDYAVETDTLTLYFHRRGSEPHTSTTQRHLATLEESTLLPEPFQGLYRKAMKGACAQATEDSLEFPASFEGEPFHWCRMHYVSVADPKGQVFRVVGRMLDISREKQAEELLRLEQQYRRAFLSETLFVYDVDISTRHFELLHAAEDAGERFHPAESYFFFRDNSHLFPPEDWERVQRFFSDGELARFRSGSEEEAKIQLRIMDLRGEWVWVEAALHPLESHDPKPSRYLLYLKVVEHQKRAEEELRNRADIDPVSNLLTRRAAQEGIVQQLEAPDAQVMYAFFLLDIDDFKHVNDTYGHRVGDEVLLAIGTALRKIFRATDLIGRLGGDEYVVFMSCPTGENLVRPKADKMLAEVRALTFPAHPELCLSISMGIALAPRDGMRFDQLYEHADRALYSMKAKGKDGYVLYADLEKRVEKC